MKLPTLKERTDRYITRVFHLCGGNVTRTAQVLGIGRATAYREVARLGIFTPKTPEQLREDRKKHAENARQFRDIKKHREELAGADLVRPVKLFWLT